MGIKVRVFDLKLQIKSKKKKLYKQSKKARKKENSL